VIEAALIAGLVAAGVGTVTAPYVAAAIMLAVSIGISFAAQALFSPPQPRPSDGQFIITQATAPRFRSYGRVKTSGVLMFSNTANGKLYRVIAMGSGPIDAVEEHWVDDNQVTLDGGGVVTSAPYHPRMIIDSSLGEVAGQRYISLEGVFPALWTADHLGKQIPSAYLEMLQAPAENHAEVWPNGGQTNYRQVQRGVRVPDVDDTSFLPDYSYSDNAARVIADYLTHPDGMRLPMAYLQNAFAHWHAAIAACGAAVPSPAGPEPRYRIWNSYRFDERPADVLQRFLQACDGILFSTPGQGLALKVGVWEEPTVTIDDGCIVAFTEVKRGTDIMQSANTIRARYTEPTGDYLETDADPWVDEADVAVRGEIAADFDFFPAPSHSQCRRLQKIMAHRLNPAWSGSMSCNLRAMNLLGERFAILNCAELGIENETVEVTDLKMIVEGTILTGLQFTFRSMTAEAYAWDGVAAREGGAPVLHIAPPIVPERTIPPPTGLVVTLSGARAVLTWDAPPNDFLQVDARWKPTAAAEWLLIPVAPGALATAVDGLQSGTEYTFQIRHRSTPTDRVTAWEDAEATATPDYDDEGSQLRRIEA
jgi:hypothetical protein